MVTHRTRYKLSAAFVKSAPVGKHNDGGGLWLHVVNETRAKWFYRFTLHGKRREMGLGTLADVPLQRAREAADRARDLLARVKDFEDRAQRESAAGITLLRLGTIPTIGPYLMPRAMPMLRKALPDMKLYLREELTESLIAGLVEGRLDLILIALPFALPPGIVVEELFADGYSLATPLDHPLANRTHVAGPDLVERQLLLLEPGHCLQRHALSSFPSVTLDQNEDFAATSLPTLVAMVEEGLGITLLPQLALDAGAATGHALTLIDLPDACPRRIVLAWRASSAHAGVFRTLGAHLKEARRRSEEIAPG